MELTKQEYRSNITGNKVKKVAGGYWQDVKTKEMLLSYQTYLFTSLSSRLKQ